MEFAVASHRVPPCPTLPSTRRSTNFVNSATHDRLQSPTELRHFAIVPTAHLGDPVLIDLVRCMVRLLHGIHYVVMRLWSLHPMHLDSCGLVALWREALLAQAVLNDETKGYRHHPQLFRFRAQFSPISFIAEYLRVVHAESVERGFGFDSGKILPVGSTDQIDVPAGQIDFEWRHLTTKLMSRAPGWFKAQTEASPKVHPLFRVIPGGIADWERS